MRQLVIILLCTIATASMAETGNNTTHNILTLEQAIINVLERSPQLKAADYEAKAAAERIRTATQSPAYHGSIELENFAGSGIHSGSDALETTLSLSKVLEAGDKARLRGDLSHNKALLLRNEQDASRLDLLAETAKRFIEIVSEQQRLLNAGEVVELAQHTKQVVEKRITAGKSPAAELQRARITLSRAELKREQTKHELDNARLKLAILWGEMPLSESQISFSHAEANLFKLEPLKPFETLAALLERNPDLVRYATEKRLAQSRSLLARSAGQSDIEISGGLRHFNATDDTALVLSLSVPFGSSSRAVSSIKEAEMMASRDPYVYQQQRLKLHATLYELHHQARQASSTVTALREAIIPQAEQALKDYEKAYSAGRYSFLELTEAQQLLLDLKLEALITASDYHRYLIEIDRLTGAGLSTNQSAGVTP